MLYRRLCGIHYVIRREGHHPIRVDLRKRDRVRVFQRQA